jgi:S-adenosylmethionine decarboxylase
MSGDASMKDDAAAPPGRAEWRHGTADVSGIPASVLDDVPRLVAAMESALDVATSSDAARAHRFEPRGASLVAVRAGCRVVAHTWPERGVLTLDVYSAAAAPRVVIERCLEALLGRSAEVRVEEAPVVVTTVRAD